MTDVVLRTVQASDLPGFFAHQTDPEANRLAAFGSVEPTDRDAFDRKWERMLQDDSVIVRAVACDGSLAGHVARYERDGHGEVTYWLGREYWGRGIATAALRAFLTEVEERPLHASVAEGNAGSLRVLQKCGFAITHTERAFAVGRGESIDELFLVLA